MKRSNPILNEGLFSHIYAGATSTSMTITGTIIKTIFLLSLSFTTAIWASQQLAVGGASIQPLIAISGIASLILGFLTHYRKDYAFATAPIYALLQGMVLGYISSIGEMCYPGIVSQALPLTFSTLFCMLALYSFGIIRVDDRFQSIIITSLMAIFFTYLLNFILHIFGIRMPYINESGPIGILFSLIVVGIASFSLLLDFEFIVQGQTFGAPKYMEWYCAYGLMVGIIWLYIEIFHLLVKMNSRNRD